MSKGNPMINIRLKPQQIAALKILAGKNGCTVTDLVRDRIEDLLQAEFSDLAADQQLPGQIRTSDLIPENA